MGDFKNLYINLNEINISISTLKRVFLNKIKIILFGIKVNVPAG